MPMAAFSTWDATTRARSWGFPRCASSWKTFHVRSGSTCQELKGAALDRFLLRKVGRTWDSVPVPHIGFPHLDTKAIAQFRALAKRSQRVALDLLYHDEIHGDLITQALRTIDLVQTKYFRASIAYEGMQRVETWPVPDAALREAVYNAILHKDYASGIPIQISVYDDKLMLWNPGVLPEHWSLETLLGKHSSKPFNPDLANAFFRAGRIEAWGRGIERIQEACRAQGRPAPELKVEGEDFWTIFQFPTQQTPVETPVQIPGSTSAKILAVLAKQPNATLEEVAAQIGKSLCAVERAASKLVQDGRLRFVGPKKAGRWEVLP